MRVRTCKGWRGSSDEKSWKPWDVWSFLEHGTVKVCMIFQLGLSTWDRSGFSGAEAKSQGQMTSVVPVALSKSTVMVMEGLDWPSILRYCDLPRKIQICGCSCSKDGPSGLMFSLSNIWLPLSSCCLQKQPHLLPHIPHWPLHSASGSLMFAAAAPEHSSKGSWMARTCPKRSFSPEHSCGVLAARRPLIHICLITGRERTQFCQSRADLCLNPSCLILREVIELSKPLFSSFVKPG